MNSFAVMQFGTPLTARLGLTLLHVLWEGVIISACLAAALVCLRRSSPVRRYWVSCLAMALLPVSAFITFAMLPTDGSAVALSSHAKLMQVPTGNASAENSKLPSNAVAKGPDGQNGHVENAGSSASANDHRTLSVGLMIRPFLPALGAAWIVGIAMLSTWRLAGWAYLHRLLNSGTAPPAPWPDILPSLCAKLKIPGPVKLLQSSRLCVPAVAGWLRPVILLPVSALTNMPVDQLQTLLAHELAHVRRHDYPINLALTAIETLFFYHPLTWWISRQIRREREDCCDDIAAEAAGSRVLYARALAGLEELRIPSTLALAASDGGLLRRVRRILAADSTRPLGGVALPLFLVTIATVGWIASMSARPGSAMEAPAAFSSYKRAVSGTVMDTEGKPLPGAAVYVTQLVKWPDIEILASATTAGNGEFSIGSVKAPDRPETSYIDIFAIVPGVGFSAPQHFVAGKAVELRLLPSAELHVPFVGPDDKPISGMHVWPTAIMIRDDSQPIPHNLNLPDEIAKRLGTRTDEHGIAVFRGLPRDSRVRFDDDNDRYALMDFNEVVPLERQGVVEAAGIHLMAAATITGSLTYSDTNKPARNIGVYAQSVTNGSGIGRTDELGHFSIDRLKPGRYVVAIQPDDDHLGDWTARAAEIDVAQGEHATANLVMIHGGIITGVVRDQETQKGLSGLQIGLHGPAHPSDAAGVQWATTNSDGLYRLRVPPGTQSIYLMSRPPDGYLRPSANPSHTENIVVGDGQTVTYNFDLPQDKSPAVVGIVLDPDGKPVAGASVSYPANEQHAFDRFVRTGPDGRFRMSGVPTNGEFRARFSQLATEAPAPYPRDSHEITLRLSDHATYSLLVRVKDDRGNAIPDATVNLITWQNQGSGSDGQPHPTDTDGTVRFKMLFTDTRYTVNVKGMHHGTNFENVQPPNSDKSREQVIELKLRSADSSISGIVVNEKGNPVADTEVVFSGPGVGMQKTRTDAKGQFQFTVMSGTHGYLYLPTIKEERGVPIASTAVAGQSDLRLVFRPIRHD